MKVTINFGPEIDVAVQYHLDGGKSVQRYVTAAVRFFNHMYSIEKEGKMTIGYGDKSRFKTYNIEMNPSSFLEMEDLT